MIDESHLNGMKKIQKILLDFLDRIDDNEENYQNLIRLINQHQIQKDRYNLKQFLYLILNISTNHHRYLNFFSKIEKILSYLINEIKHFFTNSEISNIFISNRRIILFFINEKILDLDFLNKNYDKTYLQYFTNEDQNNKEKGENDNYICHLIREDLIEEFIIYVNKECYSLNSLISHSIFETNDFLIQRKETSLIEYAAFFGSTQIFKYLYLNDVPLTSSLWLYAIHSDNAEMINLLEENKIKPFDDSYIQCINESIKCHHFDITNYILNEYMNGSINILNENEDVRITSFHYYNFSCFPKEIIDEKNLLVFCKCDYYNYVNYVLKNKIIDNKEVINKSIFFAANCNNHDILNLLFKQPGIEIGLRFFEKCYGMISIELPPTIDRIGQLAFYDCKCLSSIVLPSSLKLIENFSFYNCCSLVDIIIPSSVTEIGTNAFANCSSLKNIVIPPSVTEIGSSVFSQCISLENVSIESKISKIEYSSFCICKNLKNISIPDSVTYIGDYAFKKCSQLEQIKLPAYLKSIGINCFALCSLLTHVTIPSTVIEIGEYAFFDCVSLEQINIPYLVKKIEERTFYKCKNLNEIIFESPSSLVKIGNEAFAECNSLQTICIPQSVKEIGENSFQGCTSLKKVEINSNLTLIAKNAFNNCRSLHLEYITHSIS